MATVPCPSAVCPYKAGESIELSMWTCESIKPGSRNGRLPLCRESSAGVLPNLSMRAIRPSAIVTVPG